MNVDANAEKAIKRDQFMGKWGAVLKAFSYENEIETQNKLIEAIQQYAPPEHDDFDLELAKSLKSIDDELAKKSNRKQYFPDDKGLLKGNIPPWALDYLTEISIGMSLPQDKYRESFLEQLCKAHPSSGESRFLLACSLIQKGCSRDHNENDFRNGLDLFNQLAATLPPRRSRAEIFRIGSLYEQLPSQIIKSFKEWAIKNYVELLTSTERLEEAIKLIEAEKDEEIRANLKVVYDRLAMEMKLVKRLKGFEENAVERIHEAHETTQNKHIEILTIFIAIISIAGGGLISYFASSSQSTIGRVYSLFEFTLCLMLAMTVGLAFLARSSSQIRIRLGSSVVILIALVSLVIFGEKKNESISIPERKMDVPVQIDVAPKSEKVPANMSEINKKSSEQAL